jgi:hypothetical protein
MKARDVDNDKLVREINQVALGIEKGRLFHIYGQKVRRSTAPGSRATSKK